MSDYFFILNIKLNSAGVIRLSISIFVTIWVKFIRLNLLRFRCNLIFVRILIILLNNFFFLCEGVYSHLVFFWSWNHIDIFKRSFKIILIVEVAYTFLGVYWLYFRLKLFIQRRFYVLGLFILTVTILFDALILRLIETDIFLRLFTLNFRHFLKFWAC
jgi:hypothetical protein